MSVLKLIELEDGHVLPSFEALILKAEIRSTRKGDPMIRGTLRDKEDLVDYTIWSGILLNNLINSDIQISDRVWMIEKSKVNDYNGDKSIVISKMTPSENLNPWDFQDPKYDSDKLVKEAKTILNAGLSLEGINILNTVLRDISDKFFYIGTSDDHDNVKHGLLAHSTKTLKLTNLVLETYPDISSYVDPDLMLLGAFLHSIGKTQVCGLSGGEGILGASEQALGVLLINQYKDLIENLKSPEFFYRLLSVILEYHGGSGQQPKTVESFLIHIVNDLEVKLTKLEESINNPKPISVGSFLLD